MSEIQQKKLSKHTVPFGALYKQYQNLQMEIDEAIRSTIRSSNFIGGAPVAEFETAFGDLIGEPLVVACANGTDSIEIILESFGIGIGDEVLVPAISWISTAEAVSRVGATPVFVDIDPVTFCIDASIIPKWITSKTKAILPVHLYGRAADMSSICKIAATNNLKVIEDCAQAHLSIHKNKYVGTWGDAASFSFYPGKNLGAYGDAGCMVFKEAEFEKIARQIAHHGQVKKHHHLRIGRNSRLDTLQAAILLAKMPNLKEWTEMRRNIAEEYNTRITNKYLTLPELLSNEHVYHLYVIKTDDRQALISYLNSNGIESAIHYPTALPFLQCYEFLKLSPTNFPIATSIQHKILSIPLYPELSSEDISYIVDKLNDFSPSV